MKYPILAALALLAAHVPAAAQTITGSVTYLQRMMPPPGARLEVVVQDVSRADAPAATLAGFTLEGLGAPPYAFTIEVDPEAVEESRSYSVRATMHEGDQLLMTTDTAYPVLTRGAGTEVQMVLRMVAQTEESAVPDADLIDTYWKILTLGDQSIGVTDQQREPHLVVRSDGRYSATVGCNMISGGYELDASSLRFLMGPSTLMACVEPLDAYEAALGSVLMETAGFRIDGEALELTDAGGTTIATFQAVHLQ